jgi:hypothetical protein
VARRAGLALKVRTRARLRGRLSRAGDARPPALGAGTTITLRLSDPSEEPAIERLGELSGRPIPAGRYLVADVDGQIWAALPLSGGEPVADPFLPALEVKGLLSLRAAQLHASVALTRDERPRLAPVLSAEGRAC